MINVSIAGVSRRVVFNDREKLHQLNAIIHPGVCRRDTAEVRGAGKAAASMLSLFMEAALIFEAGLHKKLDGVVVAWCLPEQQLARLKRAWIERSPRPANVLQCKCR
jgi:dephospho-CoA kinase